MVLMIIFFLRERQFLAEHPPVFRTFSEMGLYC